MWGGRGAGLASSRAVIDGGARGWRATAPAASWTEFEECMDMVARAGAWSTRLTAVPPACPGEAADARA